MPILGDLPPPLPANEGPQERLRMAGQRNDAVPRAENIIAWRPFFYRPPQWDLTPEHRAQGHCWLKLRQPHDSDISQVSK